MNKLRIAILASAAIILGCRGSSGSYETEASLKASKLIPFLNGGNQVYQQRYDYPKPVNGRNYISILTMYNLQQEFDAVLSSVNSGEISGSSDFQKEPGKYLYKADLGNRKVTLLFIHKGQWTKGQVIHKLDSSKSGTAVEVKVAFEK